MSSTRIQSARQSDCGGALVNDSGLGLVEEVHAQNVRITTLAFLTLLSLAALGMFLTGNISSTVNKFPSIIVLLTIVILARSDTSIWSRSKTKLLILISCLPTFVFSALYNGGFGEPRTSLGILCATLTALTLFGISRAGFILGVAVLAAMVVGLLEYLGVLAEIQGHAGIGTARSAVIATPVLVAAIFMMLFLLLRLVSVQQRILITQSQKLSESLADAESARQAESRFLSNMSHEIRNPLNAVAGLIKLASTEQTLDAARRHLRSAQTASRHLSTIVNDILDFKKLESGEFSVRDERFDFGEFGQSNRALIQQIACQKNITIESGSDSSSLPRFLIGDPVRLSQILLNLVSNAVKFTPEGGTVWIDTAYDVETAVLSFKVKDNGIGMSGETLSHIFDRYYQANDQRTKVHLGTGLGLAIVKGLLDQMGGTITVESTLGEGSTFAVRVPVPLDHEREDASRAGRVDDQASGNQETDLSHVTVLCVDDDPTNLSVVVPLLHRTGADVRVAKSGTQALDILSRSSVDIVLTDISMPEMDGEELLRNIRRSSPDLPVVAVTGNVLDEDVQRYLGGGFVGVIGKPFDFDRLMEIISNEVTLA